MSTSEVAPGIGTEILGGGGLVIEEVSHAGRLAHLYKCEMFTPGWFSIDKTAI